MSHKVNRTKFIDWIDADQLQAAQEDIRHDLKYGGEYVLTASELLDRCLEVPVHLLEDYKGLEAFVEGTDCKLILKDIFT